MNNKVTKRQGLHTNCSKPKIPKSSIKNRMWLGRGKAIPFSKHMASVAIVFEIEYLDSEIPKDIYSEEFERLIEKMKTYCTPKLNENIPLDLRFSITYKDDNSFGDVGIEKIFSFLTHYLLIRLNVILPMIPNQLISEELATHLLFIPHESMLRLLDEKVIPSHRINNSRCVKSKDLFEYKKQSDESRAKALTSLIQYGNDINI